MATLGYIVFAYSYDGGVGVGRVGGVGVVGVGVGGVGVGVATGRVDADCPSAAPPTMGELKTAFTPAASPPVGTSGAVVGTSDGGGALGGRV